MRGPPPGDPVATPLLYPLGREAQSAFSGVFSPALAAISEISSEDWMSSGASLPFTSSCAVSYETLPVSTPVLSATASSAGASSMAPMSMPAAPICADMPSSAARAARSQ